MRYLIILLLPVMALAQFSGGTTKQIDQINNNTQADITINPTNKVLMPYLTDGELLYYNSGIDSLGNGTEGQILSITGGILAWIDPPLTSPTTTIGDIIYNFDGSPSGDARLAIGTLDQLLSSNGTIPVWIDPPVTSPITTEGDISIGDASGDPIRLPIGTLDQLLTSDGTTASWQDAPVSTTLTTKGDIQTYDTANQRLPVGGDHSFLVADSTQATGLAWSDSIVTALNAVTDWEVTSTPNVGSTAGGPTLAIGTGGGAEYTVEQRRVGSNVEVRYRLRVGTSGASDITSGAYLFFLPTGLSHSLSNYDAGGYGAITIVASAAPKARVIARAFGVGFILDVSDVGISSSGDGTIFSNPNFLSFVISVPIVGWSSGITAAVQNKELTAATANEFSARISSTGVVSSENYDFIDGNCTSGGTGTFNCLFKSGIFTETPSITSTAKNNSAGRWSQTASIASTGFTVYTYTHAADFTTSSDINFHVRVSKQGADVNKSQVITGTFEGINSTSLMFGKYRRSINQTIVGQAVIAFDQKVSGVEGGNIDAHFNTSTGVFTSPEDTCYSVTATGALSSPAPPDGNRSYLVLEKTAGGVAMAISGDVIGATDAPLLNLHTGKFCLTTGEQIQLRIVTGGGTSDYLAGDQYFFAIEEKPDTESIIKNLNDNNNVECEKKYLAADITSGVNPIPDLTFTSTIGSKYSLILHGDILFSGIGDTRFIIRALNNGSTITRVGMRISSTGISETLYASASDSCFVAGATTITAEAFAEIGTATINGNGLDETYMQVCKLPDNTICN